MPMLDAFKLKPFDLEPIFATWTNGPRFSGNPKKDPPVDEWLKQIKAGCVERNIPEEYWYKVAQHFMGKKAKARLDELKAVIAKVHGGSYRWTWKKFKIAMQNMGWGIDPTARETIKVQGKPSGLWFTRKRDEKENADTSPPSKPRPTPSRSGSLFWRKSNEDIAAASTPAPVQSAATSSPPRTPPPPSRKNSDGFWPVRRNSKDATEEPVTTHHQRPSHTKSKSESAVTTTAHGSPKPPTPSRSNTGDSVTTVTNAPVWLLNAVTALDFITSEHPKAMSVLSAILITAGSLPAIPAISAGAGGAVLASGAAHAIGAIAVGLGQALSTSVKNQQDGSSHSQAASTVR